MNLKRLQKVIEKIGEGLPPNDDWIPALILEGRKETSIFGMIGDSMKDFRTKDMIAEQMIKLIAMFKPNAACFITTAWSIEPEVMKKMSKLDMELLMSGELRPSQHPDRIEIVNAYCYGERGENEGEALMVGRVQRFPDKHPKITKWRTESGGDLTAQGRFPDAIKEGFRQARKEGKYGTNKTKPDKW